MNINIITYHWSNNLGAIIQSLCLKKFLENNFKNSVEFNNYLPERLIKRERNSQLNLENSSFLIQVIQKKINLYLWKKKIANLLVTKKKPVLFDKDLYIYGSDEIWNYTNPFFGFDPYFFGELNNKKKIAYGCSIGNADFKIKSNIIFDKIKTNLDSFSAISVRDQNSFNFVKKLSSLKVEIVIDPCFLSDPEIFSPYGSVYKEKFEKKNYLVIYGDYFSKNQIQAILNFSKNQSLEIISVGTINRWANKNILKVNPADLIFFIQNSKFVITSMFHGVMLSYKFKKQFWYSEDPYRKKKLEYFLEKLNLKKQEINNLGLNQIEYKDKETEFNLWKKNSSEFLINSINKLSK